MSKPKAATVKDRAAERILNEALVLFKTHGYHGMPVRQLAQAVGLEIASLYYHFPSKQDILYSLFERTMMALLDGLKQAIASGNSPAAQLRAAVCFHVLFHIAHQDEAFVSHSELRSLSQTNRRRIIARRDEYERLLRAVLNAGVKAGEFEIADVNLISTSILVMCSGVSDWFTHHGRLSTEQLADAYADIVMRWVGSAAQPGTRRSPTPHKLVRRRARSAS